MNDMRSREGAERSSNVDTEAWEVPDFTTVDVATSVEGTVKFGTGVDGGFAAS